MDNKVKLIADSFGLEINEEFDIYLENGASSFNPYKFILDRGLVDKNGHGCPAALTSLLLGQYTIKKQPWKPTWHNPYWFIQYCGIPRCANFVSDVDIARLIMGNCFESHCEAERSAKDILQKFISISEEICGSR